MWKSYKDKAKNDIKESKNCIHSTPCECGWKYAGGTGRPLETWINKHKHSTKTEDMQVQNSRTLLEW